jgi:hypothetical protein
MKHPVPLCKSVQASPLNVAYFISFSPCFDGGKFVLVPFYVSALSVLC